MAEQIQTNKRIEPVKIEAYRCSICGDIETDYQEALTHANIPLDVEPLPLGFTYKITLNEPDFTSKRFSLGVIFKTIVSGYEANSCHLVSQVALAPSEGFDMVPRGYETPPRTSQIIDEFFEASGLRTNSLLTPEELQELVTIHPKFMVRLKGGGIETLVRTCLQVEAVLRK
jgi:hypothetical protein